MADPTPQPNAVPDVVRLPLLYPIPPAEVRVLENRVYRIDAGTQLRADVHADVHADVYVPQSTTPQRRAAVLLVHGGPVPVGANPKSWQMFRDLGRLLAASGFVGVTFNHSLHAPTAYFAAQADVAALIDYVRANAEELNVDPDKLILWVFSGGGPLLTVGLDPRRSYLRGHIVYYGVLDFELLGNPETKAVPREILERLSPLLQLRKHGCRVPVLLARAGRESFPKLNDTIEAFLIEALAQSVDVELLNHARGEHAFDIRNDDPRTREIIGRTLEFIRSSTGNPS